MGFKFRIEDQQEVFFLTSTVVDWIDVFTRKELAEIVIDSLRYCQKEKGLILYAWCLMPSHLHLIVSSEQGKSISDIMRDFKKFTSKAIIQTIKVINESRKEWMLDRFEFIGRWNPKIENYKFWRDGIHPIILTSNHFIDQKLNYIHQNPVAAGLVFEPEHYAYSSAINYTGMKGLLDVVLIE